MKVRILILTGMMSIPIVGCAPIHQYPSYSGRVLEVGTNKPIEGAGVLAVYFGMRSKIIESDLTYAGYQATLTDSDGKFLIPQKTFFSSSFLSWYETDPRFSIYKHGYGNFPGSMFHIYYRKENGKIVEHRLEKYGKLDPVVPRDKTRAKLIRLSTTGTVTIWLPKLDDQEEIALHNSLSAKHLLYWAQKDMFPPEGMKKEHFGE